MDSSAPSICWEKRTGHSGDTPPSAAASRAETASSTPSPLSAEMPNTGTPMRSESLSISIAMPSFSNWSAMFTAITMGMPSSATWVERYRLRSRSVPSTMFSTAPGRSLIR